MTEHFNLVVSHGIALALGLSVGEMFRFVRKGGRLVMKLEEKEVWKTTVKQIAWVVVVVVFFASIIQSVMFTYEQRQCNEQVVNTLNYRAGLADGDRALLDKVTALLNQRDESTSKMVTDLLAIPRVETGPPGSGTGKTGNTDASRAVLEAFVTERSRIDAELKTTKEQQKKIDAERKANPLPQCAGRDR